MRKRKGIVCGIVAFCGLGACIWYFRPAPTPEPINDNGVANVSPRQNDDGNAEASEVVEPIVVGIGMSASPIPPTPPDEGPQPRVVQEPEASQPPRPDASQNPPRMPPAED